MEPDDFYYPEPCVCLECRRVYMTVFDDGECPQCAQANLDALDAASQRIPEENK